MNDPYSVLGVSSNASDEEIKRAYRDVYKRQGVGTALPLTRWPCWRRWSGSAGKSPLGQGAGRAFLSPVPVLQLSLIHI